MITLDVKISDGDLRKAIELRISECFPALDFANALAGAQDTPWQLLRKYNFIELIDEAKARGLPIEAFRGAVGGRIIADAPVYKKYLLLQRQPKDA